MRLVSDDAPPSDGIQHICSCMEAHGSRNEDTSGQVECFERKQRAPQRGMCGRAPMSFTAFAGVVTTQSKDASLHTRCHQCEFGVPVSFPLGMQFNHVLGGGQMRTLPIPPWWS